MHNCLNCNKETKNPKFCCRSCSASFINVGNKRWGNTPTNCIVCGQKNLKHTSKYCSHKCFREDTFQKKISEWKQTGKIAESVRKTNPSRVWSEEQKRRFSEIAIEKNYIARLQKYGREDKVDKSPV